MRRRVKQLSLAICDMQAAMSVYLDYNATTPLAPEVLHVTTTALRDAWANPSSSHTAGITNNNNTS